MKKVLGILFVGMLSAFFLANTTTAKGDSKDGIQFFHGTWEEALAKAKEEEKVIFMDAYASWCGPCKMMSARVFPNKEVGDYFNEHFINVKIDMEKGEGPQLSQRYGVRAYPTLFFIDANGKVVGKNVGYLKPEQLKAYGEKVVNALSNSEK